MPSNDQPKFTDPDAPVRPMVWTNAHRWPDGTARAPEPDDRPEPPHTPEVNIPGYTLPVHRHDRPVDIRDMELPDSRNVKGTHIVGASVGATIGSTAGAIVGSLVPVAGTVAGALLGAAIGGLAGGAAGAGLAGFARLRDEHEYWLQNHKTRPYYDPQYDFTVDYEPAYLFGYRTRYDLDATDFESVREHLARLWEERRGTSRLSWEQASGAVRDAWDRYELMKLELERRPQSY